MSHSLVHQGNHPIIGGFKLIMHDFLPKSVLTTPNKSYVLPVLGNSSFPSTEMKLTSLYSHGSFFFLVFLEDRRGICSLPVFCKISQLPQLYRPCKGIRPFPQHLWYKPIRLHGLILLEVLSKPGLPPHRVSLSCSRFLVRGASGSWSPVLLAKADAKMCSVPQPVPCYFSLIFLPHSAVGLHFSLVFLLLFRYFFALAVYFHKEIYMWFLKLTKTCNYFPYR